MSQNQSFKNLLDEGIRSVAAKQGESLKAVEIALAEETEYSRATIQHWRRGNPPTESETIKQLVQFCVQKGNLDQRWAERILLQSNYPDPDAVIGELFVVNERQGSAHLFICYARGQEPDNAVALTIAQALSANHTVFFDQAAQLHGWAEKIEQEVARCDFFILLLSAMSATDEVVLAEMELVQRRVHTPPKILPILLNYKSQESAVWDTYLQQKSCFTWHSRDDTVSLVTQLSNVIATNHLPQPAKESVETASVSAQHDLAPTPSVRPLMLEMPEGTISVESTYYVTRATDAIAMNAIETKGVTITIKGPRQMGKSSLLIRVADKAQTHGKQVIFLDFQLLQAAYQNADTFFRQFCTLLSMHLNLADKTEMYWQFPLTNAFRCTNYVLQEILQKADQPILLAMDEVDSVFETEFRTDFFGMLRSWHNSRALNPHWKKLDMALVTSTEPYYFVKSLSQSPFNVGEIVDLPSFTMEQMAYLNEQHQSPLDNQEMTQLMTLLNGHPYLIRRALYLIASNRISISDLFAQATDEYGPFGDHLRSILLRLHYNKTFIRGLKQVLQTGQCDDELFFRLHGIGLIERRNGRIQPRCQLYAKFFQKQFNDI